MPDLSGSFSGRVTSQSTIALHDVFNHELNLLEVRGVQKSPDEKWNNSKITCWGTADVIAGNGPQRGYFVTKRGKSRLRVSEYLPAARESSGSYRCRQLQRRDDFACGS